MSNIAKKLKGFTLVEILVVVALIAILATLTIVAVNPQKNLGDTRNAKRSENVSQVLNAINQYISEENNSISDLGTIPTCPTTANIGTDTVGGNIDLTSLVTNGYISDIPNDPQATVLDGTDTEYTICINAANRVQIAAPNAENGKTIEAK